MWTKKETTIAYIMRKKCHIVEFVKRYMVTTFFSVVHLCVIFNLVAKPKAVLQ